MKYLKKFDTHSDYQTYITGQSKELPNVSLCVQENEVHYNLAHNYAQDYFTFVALEDGTFTFGGYNSIYYSLDNGQTWETLEADVASPVIRAGEKIIWKAVSSTLSEDERFSDFDTIGPGDYSGIGIFSSTGQFNVEGNIASLVAGDYFTDSSLMNLDSYQSNYFQELFMECNTLINAENLILPYNSIIYRYYCSMFSSCTNLVTAPKLPAMILDLECYSGMFNGCSSLTSAPELPVTTLAQGCYNAMFYDCTSLMTAPELPATTLVYSCYQYMFQNCTNLNYIKCLATDMSAKDCTTGWVEGVASTGTFIKASNTTNWETGDDGIPEGWTVETNE